MCAHGECRGDILMKKRISIIVTCSLVATLAVGCSSNTNTKSAVASAEAENLTEIKTKLDKEFTDYYGPDKFSGYVYNSKKGNVLLDKGYGKADYEKGTENTKQTKYDIGSITKQITAFGIMQLQEKKLLDVNDKVDKYLPAFPHGNEITIHQLLCHTSGLTEYSTEFDIKKFRPSYKNFGVEGKDEKVNFLFSPGKGFQYSNPGYVLLGYIIEKVSGETLDVYLKKNIFDPLDMKNTSFRDETGHLSNLATGYETENKEKIETSWTLENIGFVYGSGGLCSTIEDMLKWEKALTEQKLISKESYERIYTPNENNYGYGWYIFKDSAGKRSYEHYGTGVGFRTYFLRGVDEDVKVIIITNYLNAPLEDMAGLTKDYLK
ncbi:beta-lactamase [Clostridiales bacterium oral taxon 876 str. F0540]|nr:beta-lactamase [Clostridiales bacterium oral taxon 876 str. F0540]